MKCQTKSWCKWGYTLLGSLLMALLIKIFFITTCFIPHKGMQNTLYEGEGIWVNKWSYGWRVSFLSLFGYHRVGNVAVKKGDVVVYNKPVDKPKKESVWIDFSPLCISRCIGLPGDTLYLDEVFFYAEEPDIEADNKRLYSYPIEAEEAIMQALSQMKMTENVLAGYTKDGKFVRSFSEDEYNGVVNLLENTDLLIPLHETINAEIHPYVIPKAGASITIEAWNIHLLCNAILRHEGKDAYVKDGKLFVNGKSIKTYRFTQNYFWMVSDEPLNVNDSRLYGLIPESHIVGKAVGIWWGAQIDRFFKRIV